MVVQPPQITERCTTCMELEVHVHCKFHPLKYQLVHNDPKYSEIKQLVHPLETQNVKKLICTAIAVIAIYREQHHSGITLQILLQWNYTVMLA